MEIYLLNKTEKNDQTLFTIWSIWAMNLLTLKSSPLLPRLSTIAIQNGNDKEYWMTVTVPSNEFEAIIDIIRNICAQMDICLFEAYDQIEA